MAKQEPLKAEFVSMNWQTRGNEKIAIMVIEYGLMLQDRHVGRIAAELYGALGKLHNVSFIGKMVTIRVGDMGQFANQLNKIREISGYDGLVGRITQPSPGLEIGIYGGAEKRVKAAIASLREAFGPNIHPSLTVFGSLDGWTIVIPEPKLLRPQAYMAFRNAMMNN